MMTPIIPKNNIPSRIDEWGKNNEEIYKLVRQALLYVHLSNQLFEKDHIQINFVGDLDYVLL